MLFQQPESAPREVLPHMQRALTGLPKRKVRNKQVFQILICALFCFASRRDGLGFSLQ
jgi:hypothetical protein